MLLCVVETLNSVTLTQRLLMFLIQQEVNMLHSTCRLCYVCSGQQLSSCGFQSILCLHGSGVSHRIEESLHPEFGIPFPWFSCVEGSFPSSPASPIIQDSFLGFFSQKDGRFFPLVFQPLGGQLPQGKTAKIRLTLCCSVSGTFRQVFLSFFFSSFLSLLLYFVLICRESVCQRHAPPH